MYGTLIAALLDVPITHRPERTAPVGVFLRVRFLRSTDQRVPTELPLANELVDASAVAEADVDVAAGVDPTTVAGTAAVEACQYVSGSVQDADPGRRIVDAALADVQDALAVHGDVHGPLDVVPDGDETRHPG